MDYANSLNSEEFAERRKRLLVLADSAVGDLGREVVIDEGFVRDFASDYVREGKYDGGMDGLQFDILTTTDLLDQLLICVDEDVCDGSSADRFVLNGYLRFGCFYRALILDLRRKYRSPSIGERFLNYVDKGGGCSR